MKTLSCPCKYMKSLTCLHNQSLQSGWQTCLFRFAQSLSTRIISSSYLHGISKYHCDTQLKPHNTNSQLLNLSSQESQANICRLFLQREFHSLARSCASGDVNVEGLRDLCSRNNVIECRGSSRSSRSHDEENEEKLLHKYMMEKLSIENGMLSWFRNTYILTLVSLTSLQYDTSPFPPSVIGAFAITTAMMNLTVGTGKYITTFMKLHRMERLHGTQWQGHVLFALIHYCLFITVLWAIFPGIKKAKDDWKDYKAKDG